MINDEKTRIVVPMHPGKDIKPGLSKASRKQDRFSVGVRLFLGHRSLQSKTHVLSPRLLSGITLRKRSL